MTWGAKDCDTDKLTMTGSEYEYDIPDNARTIDFQANGGDVQIYFDTSKSARSRTIFNRCSVRLTNPNLSGKTIYFNGAVGSYIEVIIGTGLWQ
jgi:hypothetical protein